MPSCHETCEHPKIRVGVLKDFEHHETIKITHLTLFSLYLCFKIYKTDGNYAPILEGYILGDVLDATWSCPSISCARVGSRRFL